MFNPKVYQPSFLYMLHHAHTLSEQTSCSFQLMLWRSLVSNCICHGLILAGFCRSHIDGLVSFWGCTWHTKSQNGCHHWYHWYYHWVGYDNHPYHRDHWFHQTGWLENGFVDVRSSHHSQCSVEPLCSQYLWNQQMEGNVPVIEDGWSLFEMKGCSKGFLISFSEIVHVVERFFSGLKAISGISEPQPVTRLWLSSFFHWKCQRKRQRIQLWLKD